MMHCTMDDLVALRDGEGSIWARRHLEACAACRAEVDALYQRVAQLKALPALRPPRDRWLAVRDAVRGGQRRRRRLWSGLSLAAAAALAALVVFRPFGGTATAHADQLARAKARSAELESTLGQVDREGRVMSGREAAIAAALEDRIAFIDGELARLEAARAQALRAELVELWQERGDMMEQLLRVRVTRAVYVGL